MRILSFIVCWFFASMLMAQLVVKPLSNEPTATKRARSTTTTTTNNASPVQVPFIPFWDDFSISTNTVDSIRVWGTDSILQWDPSQSRGVFVNATLAINPPTFNVATFDGLNENGAFYNTNLNASAEETDRLGSYPINLEGASNVHISFYWQAGGNVELPDSDDFLQLVIEDLRSGKDTVLWDQFGGEDLNPDGTNETEFVQEVLPIPSDFLSDSVRFIFSSFGDPDGPFDAWHIDWVYLNSERSQNQKQTGYRDGALTGQLTSPFFPFQSVPIDQFIADDRFVRNQQIGIRSLNQLFSPTSFFNVRLEYSLTLRNDGFQILSDIRNYSILGVDNDPNDGNETRPDTVETLMISNRDTQANRLLSEENFSRIFDFDSVVLTSEVVFIDNNSSNVQEIPRTVVDLIINDTIRQDYLLQDFYAYDDGSAEFAAGTNVSNGQIAVKFWVEQADTLTHIDINFPNISPNQNGTSINLNVYTKLDSTGLLRTQQVSVINNITRDAFTRYRLDRPVIVSDTFFIGYQQFINDFLPVGFDRSNPEASQYIFENRNDGWIQNISLRGALMIRPVFSDSTVVILAQEDVPKPTTPEFNVYPNPSKGTIQIEGKYDKIELLDLSGRILLSERNAPSHQLNHDPGIYLLRVYHGNDFEIKKIILDSSL